MGRYSRQFMGRLIVLMSSIKFAVRGTQLGDEGEKALAHIHLALARLPTVILVIAPARSLAFHVLEFAAAPSYESLADSLGKCFGQCFRWCRDHAALGNETPHEAGGCHVECVIEAPLPAGARQTVSIRPSAPTAPRYG